MPADAAKRFNVESLLPSRGIVFARQIDSGNFRLTEHSTLGGYRVKHFDPNRPERSRTMEAPIWRFSVFFF